MSLLCIVQARMGSTRLPGKALLPLAGVPMLAHVLRRACATETQIRVCLAIPEGMANDPLAAIGEAEGVLVYRGSEEDVLGRFWAAAQLVPDADVIVRLTADDPFKSPDHIDAAVTLFASEWADRRDGVKPPHYMWLGGPTWPTGCDVEVFSRLALDLAHESASAPEDRGHVTLWMKRNLGAWVIKNPTPYGSYRDRWTVDAGPDYAFAVGVYDRLYKDNPLFGFEAMVEAGYATKRDGA